MKNIRYIHCLFYIILFFHVVSCSNNSRIGLDRFVDPNAEDVSDFTTTDGNREQLNYVLEMTYPEVAVKELKLHQLEKEGWKKCSSEKMNWDRFIDSSGTNERVIHEKVLFYKKNNNLLTFAMRYYSPIIEKSSIAKNSVKVPDNNRQFVIIVSDKFKDIGTVLTNLKVTCD